MKEYIDREKACAEIDKGDLLVGNNAEWAKEIVHRTPTADVVEVRHGYWTAHPASYECSICENEFFVEGYAEDYDAVEDWDLHYCPNCGAKMDGERKEQE